VAKISKNFIVFNLCGGNFYDIFINIRFSFDF